MQRDLGSRDTDFIQAVKDVRSELLKVAGKFYCNHSCIFIFIFYFLKIRLYAHVNILRSYVGVDEELWTTVPMQGSGTFSVEAVFQTAIPKNGRVLKFM